MKILIVDDDLNKIRQLAEFIKSHLPDADLLERHSYQSGLKAAMLDTPVLIILDMTLPNYDIGGKETGARERRYGGLDILAYLQRRRIATKAIVVTQFEEFGEGNELMTLRQLHENLVNSYPNLHLGTVHYQAAGAEWRVELGKLIDQVK